MLMVVLPACFDIVMSLLIIHLIAYSYNYNGYAFGNKLDN